jgi:hypothetical protein
MNWDTRLIDHLRDHLLQTIAQDGEEIDCPPSRTSSGTARRVGA